MSRVPRAARGAMGSLQWALSWLVVLAVGLAQMLVYWVARVVGAAVPAQPSAVGAEVRAGPAAGNSDRVWQCAFGSRRLEPEVRTC